ncbi:hypothetical protein D3H65_29950 [Paraflavitalea soli]|uniref:Uncharacterized protein n=1 Tax=Paraflavitalea soli TaxID=2315862 RepID=A0A3B7MXZ6_9BACT|nr:hypothetical protein D3H65_29950 [Paraflavitalea soli]
MDLQKAKLQCLKHDFYLRIAAALPFLEKKAVFSINAISTLLLPFDYPMTTLRLPFNSPSGEGRITSKFT